ncbi:NEW3 domain-containing protein [Pseudopedobacter beijingensis]|uniref:NEW3 domain-containing protein n=1 Tax=Pseudopedobacter beijingensis TaxID=1207056 RepID=A0ABW4I9M9_9SPHI
MSSRGNKLRLIFLGIILMVFTKLNAQNVQLYTTYPKIAVSPGEVVDYNIELINNSNAVKTSDISISSLPKGWHYELKSGNYVIDRLSVLPKDRKPLNLKLFIPGIQNKGSYTFYVSAGEAKLPLTIKITEEGVSSSELTSSQTNMEGAANSTFTYNATLFNRSSDNQVYALSANIAPGWGIVFKSEGKQVSSVNIEPNQRKDIIVEINAPEGVKKGNYKIPVRATNGNNQSEIVFEVVVTGSYKLELTTPSGALSTTATSGSVKKVQLSVKNTGASDLSQINLSSEAPSNWEVIFEPTRITTLKAGESATVNMNIKPTSNAIAGDYVVTASVRSSETSGQAQFRITVETSILKGWFGITLIALAIGVVYYLIRKYGRR